MAGSSNGQFAEPNPPIQVSEPDLRHELWADATARRLIRVCHFIMFYFRLRIISSERGHTRVKFLQTTKSYRNFFAPHIQMRLILHFVPTSELSICSW